MAGMNLGFLLVAIGFFGAWRVRGNSVFGEFLQLPEFRRYLICAGIMAGACLLSLVCARIFPYAYAGHDPEITLHGLMKIWYMFCPLILCTVFSNQLSTSPETFERILRTWWATVVLLSGVAVIQFYTGIIHPQGIPTNPGRYHATLFLGHHLSTASILIFPAFTAISVVLGAWRRKAKIPHLELIAATGGILILFLSYARAAWLSVPLGILLILGRNLRLKTFLTGSAGFLGSLILLSRTEAVRVRIQNSMGIQDRLNLWIANLDFFRHRPITGIGWLKTQEMSEYYFKEKYPEHYKDFFWGHAHNNLFEMLGGTGLIGTAAFLIWSAFTFQLALRTAKKAQTAGEHRLSDLAYGILTALILLHLNGMTNVTFWEGKVMHQQMLGVSILLVIDLLLRRGAKNQIGR